MCNWDPWLVLWEDRPREAEIGKVSHAFSGIRRLAERILSGFSPDPALSGIAVAQTIRGIQDAGVMACTKHYIGNEQGALNMHSAL